MKTIASFNKRFEFLIFIYRLKNIIFIKPLYRVSIEIYLYIRNQDALLAPVPIIMVLKNKEEYVWIY